MAQKDLQSSVAYFASVCAYPIRTNSEEYDSDTTTRREVASKYIEEKECAFAGAVA
jgi:hypothetical protein